MLLITLWQHGVSLSIDGGVPERLCGLRQGYLSVGGLGNANKPNEQLEEDYGKKNCIGNRGEWFYSL